MNVKRLFIQLFIYLLHECKEVVYSVIYLLHECKEVVYSVIYLLHECKEVVAQGVVAQ